MKVGYLGPAHSYTDEAARAAFPGAEHLPLQDIGAVFAAVAQSEVDRGVVPMENILQGPVTETREALAQYAGRVTIVDMHVLRIAHALGALPGHGSISQVLSKDQALRQCSVYLTKHLPGARQVETTSTARAVQMIAEGQLRDAAAVGSAAALKAYGLEVVALNIGDAADNKTTFAVLALAAIPAFNC